jgi:sigma-E factor negative regulatory protein RseA
MAALNKNSPEMLASLSAMFDGEATEQDIERLLQGDSAELSRQSESFHLIQQTLHKDSVVSAGLADSLLLRIRAELDADESEVEKQDTLVENNLLPFVSPKQRTASRPVWKVMLSSVAVAASVTFVVIFGGSELLTSDSTTPNLVAEARSPASNMVVTPLAELDKNALQADNVRLQHYLRQHAEQAAMTVGQGMIPMARVVSYPITE